MATAKTPTAAQKAAPRRDVKRVSRPRSAATIEPSRKTGRYSNEACPDQEPTPIRSRTGQNVLKAENRRRTDCREHVQRQQHREDDLPAQGPQRRCRAGWRSPSSEPSFATELAVTDDA